MWDVVVTVLAVWGGLCLVAALWYVFLAGTPQSTATSDDFEQNRREE